MPALRLRGAATLVVAGQGVRISGGPFDALPPGANGLCLEAGAARIGEARWRLDIPDYQVPEPEALRLVLGSMLVAMTTAPDAAYHIGCLAGLGRTGLALACLARMSGIAGDPVLWVRANYHPKAVENPAQEAFVRGFTA
ncbi:protein-tyrosine phosphatase family protein [Plastoroseomonas arctica]|uniref:Tyrosine specific protein phosphatases domain-containing protein n=1 Tax=Plastoroseomonas arctica TaxID=1509237 RepID=A0AAF1K4L2_9PROT|nr:hypothetical protein [Plastoroseomonas arctica]MBR0656628.1 hypothetical protein [Plastoroseomonas arctica]